MLAEPTLLTAVFQNLLATRSSSAASEAPHITVSAARDGEFWLFAVADNGIGIAPEYADRIFVIFQRLHDKSTYPGTGIGLAMCRKIIEYHGGRIWLDTSVTGGARFCFTLPAVHTVDQVSRRGPKIQTRHCRNYAARDHGRIRGPCPILTRMRMTTIEMEGQLVDVLLVEDDAGDVLMTREAFDHYKIRNTLHVVSDGEQALEFVRRTGDYADAPRPGLIMLDLNLPRRDGLEVLAELKADPELRRHPGRDPDHLPGRGGHPAQLLPARQRLRDQAGGLRELHGSHPADRRLLHHRGQAPR